jgi:hypothetical protein
VRRKDSRTTLPGCVKKNPSPEALGKGLQMSFCNSAPPSRDVTDYDPYPGSRITLFTAPSCALQHVSRFFIWRNGKRCFHPRLQWRDRCGFCMSEKYGIARISFPDDRIPEIAIPMKKIRCSQITFILGKVKEYMIHGWRT